MHPIYITELLKDAFAEDLGMADLTSNSIFSETETAKGSFTAKADGVLAGLTILEYAYPLLSDDVSVFLYKKDGDFVAKGQVIAEVEGSVRALLSGERVILNLIQHASGIATATADVIERLNDSSISITDTRKTLPGLRALQKYAVRCGGGQNHRFRLDDGVMIKDNHIKAAGSITKAVEIARTNIGHMVKIEVETESKAEVLEAVKAKADVIMLDNRSPEEVKVLAALIPDTIVSEVSGGITPENIAGYRGCGCNIISLGWLTHSVKAFDISFNLTYS